MTDRTKEMDRSLRGKGILDTLHTTDVELTKVLDRLNRGSLAKRKAGLKGGGIAKRGLGKAFSKGGKV